MKVKKFTNFLCQNCEKLTAKNTCHLKNSKKLFCSLPCCYEYKNKFFDVNCIVCQHVIKKKQSQIAKSNVHFCSTKCRLHYKKLDIQCWQCKNIFKLTYAEKRKRNKSGSIHLFCSRKCFKLSKEISRIANDCPHCKTQFSQSAWKRKNYRYCSSFCKENADEKLEKSRKFKNGIGFYRKIAFQKWGKKCFSCNDTKHLEIHHVNSDRSNNTKENLRPLCRKCHHHVHKGRLCLIL